MIHITKEETQLIVAALTVTIADLQKMFFDEYNLNGRVRIEYLTTLQKQIDANKELIEELRNRIKQS